MIVMLFCCVLNVALAIRRFVLKINGIPSLGLEVVG